MLSPTLGIQLYTLRDFCRTAEDFDGTLAYLARLGVKEVQISAIGPIPIEEQSRILKKYGMNVCVTHKAFERIINDTDALISEHKAIHCDAIGLGAMGEEYRKSRENADRFISSVNSISDKLKAAGMTFNYHNHNFEFEPLDNGELLMDYLIGHTDPTYFNFIPDVAWIHAGGQKPEEYLYKMRGRVKVCHFKDCKTDGNGIRHFCTLGEGEVDLEACYKACCELDIPYIVYEQDTDWAEGDAKKATALSWAFMQTLKK